MTEVIDLTKHARLVVAPDPNPSNPREYGAVITGTYTAPWAATWGRSVEGPPALYDHPGRLVEAVEHFEDTVVDRVDEAIERWSWVTHGLVIRRWENTYWYCDRNMFEHLYGGEFDRDNQLAVIESEHSEYESYVRGDARVVTFQRLARFKRVTRKYHEKQEDLLEVWENVAYIGGSYLDDTYGPAEVAFEYFFAEMSRKEQAVVTAMVDQHRVERAL